VALPGSVRKKAELRRSGLPTCGWVRSSREGLNVGFPTLTHDCPIKQ